MAGLTYKKWLEDLPHQFNALPNWEVLIKAFSDEIDELLDVFDELNTLTCIDSASGENLDMIGSIVNLTRTEAFSMISDKSAGYADDEAYRACIKYQVVRLNSDFTYSDLRTALALLLGSDNGIRYVEEEEHPATIVLESDAGAGGDEVRTILNTPILKAGGVSALIRAVETHDLVLATGISTHTTHTRESTLDEVDFKNEIICLADENGNMLCDEAFNLLISEESIIQGEPAKSSGEEEMEGT